MYCVFWYIFLLNYFDCLSSFLCVWQTFLHSWLYTEPQVLLAFAGILLLPLFLLSSPFVDILIWRNQPQRPTWRSPFLHVHLLICECLSSNFSMSCLPMEVSLLYYKPRRVFSLHVPSCCCRRIVRMPIRTVGEKYFSKRETEGRNRLWVMSGITPLLYSPLLIFSLSLISFFPYFDRHMVRSLWEMYTVTLIAIIHTHTHTHTHQMMNVQ